MVLWLYKATGPLHGKGDILIHILRQVSRKARQLSLKRVTVKRLPGLATESLAPINSSMQEMHTEYGDNAKKRYS